jgi:hypothetical protein
VDGDRIDPEQPRLGHRTFDRAVGWILTDSWDVDFKESAVHGKGLRHKLRLALKAVGVSRTPPRWSGSSTGRSSGWKCVLWMIERKAVTAPGQTLETGILDAIQQAL